MSEVSVVIATYNRQIWLAELLDALGRQSLVPEVIVADDGTRDPLGAQAYPLVAHYLWNRHDGYHRVARYNQGVALVRTPYLVLMDDDCLPKEPEFLAAYCEALAQADCVRGLYWHEDAAKLTPWFSTANLGLRTPLAQRLGPFDWAYDGGYGYEDSDLGYALAAAGARVDLGGPATAAFHRGLSNPNQHVRVHENLAYYKQKWNL